MGITWRDFSGEGEGRNSGETVQGRRSIIRHKIDGERLKNGMGNTGLKELICTTHGHELSGRNAGSLVFNTSTLSTVGE